MPSLNRLAMLKRADQAINRLALVEAQTIAEQLLGENRNDAEAWFAQSRIAIARGRIDEAVRLLNKCVARHPREVKFLIALGGVYVSGAQHDLAIRTFNKAMKVRPDDARVTAGLCEALEKHGETERAAALLEPILDRCGADPVLGLAYAQVALSAGRPRDAVDMLQKNCAAGPVPRSTVFLLGKAFERLGEYDSAFEAYQGANRPGAAAFNLDQYIERIEQLMQVFSPENLARLPRSSVNSSSAVFVTGMPRSGTTLEAKIIAAHPDAIDVGEVTVMHELLTQINLIVQTTLSYPQCALDLNQAEVNTLGGRYLEATGRLAGRPAARIVDKTLDTVLNLGMIELMLPQARVVWCRRDPLDNCVACYTEFLGAAVSYASDLRMLGLVYRLTERLWRHWQRALKLPVLEVSYERLVTDQEAQTRRVIEFVGLPWNDSCLKFHEIDPGRARGAAAHTLSYQQVRQPIYTSSVGRAARFAKHLGPLREALDEGAARWAT